MADALAFLIATEITILFAWWRKGGLNDVAWLADLITRSQNRRGGRR